jgi:hypothetical protein
MNNSDLSTLCTALGFMAVAAKDGVAPGNAARARALALLAEEFCRTATSDSFGVAVQDNAPPEKGQGSAVPAKLWACTHREDCSLIEAKDATGVKTAIAEIRARAGADTPALAEGIVAALNDASRKDTMINELTACLEMCLASDHLKWDAEHDSEITLARAKKGLRTVD